MSSRTGFCWRKPIINFLSREDTLKDDFFAELKRWRTVQPADLPWVATYGNLFVPVSLFVHCLNAAECPTIRFKYYGQKLPMTRALLGPDPAQADHVTSNLNECDIGRMLWSPHIFLFAPTFAATNKKMSKYTMIVPVSGDFGSVMVDIRYGGSRFKVRIYPRIVHMIKSFKSRLQGEVLRTLAGVRKRGRACLKMSQTMGKVSAKEMGGFRLEVTVQAHNLSTAERIVQ